MFLCIHYPKIKMDARIKEIQADLSFSPLYEYADAH